ncbi:ATP-binding protein [Sorangium sp. So ce185]|uniref:sensor histidine kinase n=1 Tax=Sorangium sp. So ce185 TaxID=3133287 RepID=UPI003F63E882
MSGESAAGALGGIGRPMGDGCPPDSHAIPQRYGGAVLAGIAAVGMTALVWPNIDLRNGYFLLPLIAIVFVSVRAGFGPAIATGIIGGFGGAYLVLEPRGSFAVDSRADVLVLSLYCVVGLATGGLGAAVRSTHLRTGALAAQHAALHEQAKRRAAQQAAVAAVGQQALAGAATDDLLESAARQTAAALGTEEVGVFEVLPDGITLVRRAAVGRCPRAAGSERIDAGPGTQAGHTLSRVEAVVFDDLPGDRRFRPAPCLLAQGIKSGMSVSVHGFGALCACTTRARRFTDDEVHFIGAIANVLASAILCRRAEAQRARLYQDAEDAIKRRDDFLALAAHELKTPLTPLRLLAGSILRAVQRNTPAEALREKTAVILRQVDRLAELVDDLLDVSRLTAGRLDLQLEEVDLAAVVRDVAWRFRDSLSRAGYALRVAADEPVSGRWDRTRVDQIVTNLLSNAAKYGAGNPIDVEVAGDDRTALLVVRDRGIGIAPQDHVRIFERFERAADHASYGGLGLGLWIVRHVLASLGGTIRVESALGAGTTFIVELPRRAAGEDGDGRHGAHLK